MAQQNAQQEPTMEEILASIRRIISEDADEGAKSQTSSAHAKIPEPEPADDDEEILDLTEVVENEPAPAPVTKTHEPAQSIQHAPVTRLRQEPAPKPVEQQEDEVMLVDRDRDSQEEPLLSSSASSAMASAFGALSERTRVSNDPSVTLEDIVHQMLKPLLKEWLEHNLPPLVERLVQEEIERAARQGGRRR